ncbi:sulfotransferase family protein [Alteromonas sp. HB246098]
MNDIGGKAPLFVVGTPRSGSTLLTSFLASHPNIYSGAETQFFNKIGLNSSSLSEALKSENWPHQAALLMKNRLTLSDQSVLELYGKNTSDIEAALSKKEPSLKAMLESIVERKSTSSQSRWLEKTPNHLKHLKEIRNEFPSAKIILIHRDLRDSSVSIPKLPWASNSVIDNAALISSWFIQIDNEFNSPNFLTVSYEKLVTESETTLKKVFEFIGEEFDRAVLSRSNATDITSEGEPWKKDIFGKIDTSSVGRWKKSMPSNLLKQVEEITGDVLIKLGYEATSQLDFECIQIKKLRGQKLDTLDDYIDLLNSNNLALTYSKQTRSLILVERNRIIRAFAAAIKLRLLDKKSIYFLGESSFILKMIGRYLT